jgi:polyisoprenoid-binding protein YceI
MSRWKTFITSLRNDKRKLAAYVIGGVAVIVVLAIAVPKIIVSIWFDDAPKKFDESSLDSVLGATTTTAAGDPVTSGAAAAPTTAPAGGAATTAAAGAAVGTDGTWNVANDSVVGYRVEETLAGADTEGAGRTSSITGTMTISGTTVSAVDLTVDMTTFKSDQSQRDSQFNGRIMEVSTFPTATFKLTTPIDIGSIPADGTSVSVKATGDLTLHGVTKSVIFDLTAKETNGRIGVVGSTVITFADYNIDNPSNGFATTGDNGTLELQLIFDHA